MQRKDVNTMANQLTSMAKRMADGQVTPQMAKALADMSTAVSAMCDSSAGKVAAQMKGK